MPTNRITRRDLLLVGGAFAAAVAGRDLWRKFQPGVPSREAAMYGAELGHRLRTRDFPEPTEFIDQDVVIAGGGVAGLSAAYHLKKNHGVSFTLLELEARTGGNSIWGENSVTRFPWAAHYLPIPDPANTPLIDFLQTAGVVKGRNAAGLPIYDETYACHDPHERCFDGEHWSAGLLPAEKMTPTDRAEMERFSRLMDGFRRSKGRDGKPAFAIPADLSSRDSELLAYDGISMADYLAQNDFHSPVVRWYVNYCMRDDFGATLEQVSAWAGLHYFGARGGKSANLNEQAVLTWPEGNGWLCGHLSKPVVEHVRTGQVVFRVRDGGEVDAYDAVRGISRRYRARRVIYSAPRYTAFHAIDGYQNKFPVMKAAFQYSTWLIANVTVDVPPPSLPHAPLSWDNIRHESELLGYIVATHQDIKRFQKGTVLTVYWPLTHLQGTEARQWARNRSTADWKRDVLAELERMHPGITSSVREIETKVWGHAMIQPLKGFMTSEARRQSQEDFGRVIFAHTDMTGLSIFEHGFEAGRRAALRAVERRA